jgi:hypothetical protein
MVIITISPLAELDELLLVELRLFRDLEEEFFKLLVTSFEGKPHGKGVARVAVRAICPRFTASKNFEAVKVGPHMMCNHGEPSLTCAR